MEIYVKKLIANLTKKKYGKINLILDGGAFSGSYILGSLYYLKELELQNKIKIHKMSGCSIGSLLCVLYKLNDLDYCCDIYGKIRTYFKEHGNLYILSDVLKDLKSKMPNDFYKLCNNTVYLNYHDISTNQCIFKKTYQNNDELLETIMRSSYIPFICGETAFYKKKYIDGLVPYTFKKKRTLFINLCMDYKCMIGMMNIKNEVNNIERIMCGILNVHNFFVSETPTTMCYYINEMTLTQKILHIFRLIIIRILVAKFYISNHLYSWLEDNIKYSKYCNLINVINSCFKNLAHMYIRYFMV
tara:strand:- start:2261 stop:3163 length:903 start_codon:yes stop_codon:yes gene_type:complete